MENVSKLRFKQVLLGCMLGAGGFSLQAATPALQPLVASATSVAAMMPPAEPIAHFGKDGSAVPQVVRELLPPDFYNLNLTRAIADPQNFSAVIDLGELLAVEGGVNAPIVLSIVDDSGADNDLVLVAPATGKGADRNFLIRLTANSERRVDISELSGAPNLYLLSLKAFTARVELPTSLGKDGALEIRTASAARAGADAANSGGGCFDQKYCSNCAETITIAGAAGSVQAQAVRSFWQISSSGHKLYKVNVQYPVAGPTFHCHLSTFTSGTECKAGKYHTFKAANPGFCAITLSPAAHAWDNLDATLFQGVTSTARCLSGCSDIFTVTRN